MGGCQIFKNEQSRHQTANRAPQKVLPADSTYASHNKSDSYFQKHFCGITSNKSCIMTTRKIVFVTSAPMAP